MEDIAEEARLHKMCADIPREASSERWDPIRQWLTQNDQDLVLDSLEYVGEYETTSLHMACKHKPPLNVIRAMVERSPQIIQAIDRFTWLPLHYACASGASEEVLRYLITAYPQSKTAIDNRGRTPLHFSVGNESYSPSPEIIELLSDSGAARCADENGSLPLHYACAYGSTVEVLEVLLNAVPVSTISVDFKGRTPLHFAMGNAEKSYAPMIVKLLLEKNPDVVNDMDNDGHLPLQLLANEAKKVSLDAKAQKRRDNILKCMDYFLSIPVSVDASVDYLNSLKNLPNWLLDHAVISEPVQKILNEKISQRFPTLFLLLDGFLLLLMIIVFRLAIHDYIDYRVLDQELSEEFKTYYLGALFICSIYYATFEVIQMLSLISLDKFSAWYTDFQNWLDMARIIFTLAAAFVMHSRLDNEGDIEQEVENIRRFFALTTVVLWTSMVFFLRSTMIDFSVFVYGVIYIVQNLLPFLLALSIILFAFSQMFVTSFQNDMEACPNRLSNDNLEKLMQDLEVLIFDNNTLCSVYKDYYFDPFVPDGLAPTAAPSDGGRTPTFAPTYAWDGYDATVSGREYCLQQYKEQYCDGGDCSPFCEFWTSFLEVWIMLIGEVVEPHFGGESFTSFLYILFGFTIVILLANVLIAIVTAYYGVVRNQRAEIVFWSNRLDFVAEMDAIRNGFSKICFCFVSNEEDEDDVDSVSDRGSFNRSTSFTSPANNVFGRAQWEDITEVFEPTDASYFSGEFWCITFTRLIAIVLVPTWLFVGLATFGWLWPPQIREWCFVAKYTRASKGKTEEIFNKNLTKALKEVNLRNEVLTEQVKSMDAALKMFLKFQE